MSSQLQCLPVACLHRSTRRSRCQTCTLQRRSTASCFPAEPEADHSHQATGAYALRITSQQAWAIFASADAQPALQYSQAQGGTVIVKSHAQAPGYFSVVQRAMDFTTLSGKVSSGAYSDWNAFLADLELIFMNAMKYNTPDTIYHKHVRGARPMLLDANRLHGWLGSAGLFPTAPCYRVHNRAAVRMPAPLHDYIALWISSRVLCASCYAMHLLYSVEHPWAGKHPVAGVPACMSTRSSTLLFSSHRQPADIEHHAAVSSVHGAAAAAPSNQSANR